jgi:chorismate-pyruvate lyase
MSEVAFSDDSRIDIRDLLNEFYDEPIGHSQLGEFNPVERVPAPYDSLLDHHAHMTVTVESHYDEKVNVIVHRCQRSEAWYAREISLVTEHTGRIVQYGIVRLDTRALEDEVWKQIESQSAPLGRVLIEHNVLREVQLCGLWEVHAGESLAELMRLDVGGRVYGRTALIYCDRAPAIELLEIVSPTSAFEA